MATLNIRNLPDDVYETLKTMAAENHRSMQEHVRWIIEREARLAGRSGLIATRNWRSRLAGRKFGDTVDEVRDERRR